MSDLTTTPKILTQIEDALAEARRLKISVDSIITALERATGFVAWASQENRRLVRDLKRDEQFEDVSRSYTEEDLQTEAPCSVAPPRWPPRKAGRHWATGHSEE